MPRYAVRLSFDGQAFSGTAPQPNQATVVSHLQRALTALEPDGNQRVRTCSRLDAGVSATALVVDIDVERAWVPAELARALTSHLQPTAAVRAIAEVADDWDALLNCQHKTYVYRVQVSPVPPVLSQRVWWLRRLTHPHLLPLTAQAVVGQRDLSAFAALRHDETDSSSPVRSYLAAEWRCAPAAYDEGGQLYSFHITGAGFLYKQVRGLVGAMVAVARGKVPLASFEQACVVSSSADSRSADGHLVDGHPVDGHPAGAQVARRPPVQRLGQFAPAQGLQLQAVVHQPSPDWHELSQ